MLKKLSAAVLAVVMLFALSACSRLKTSVNNSEEESSSVAEEKIDWTQGVAPSFDKKQPDEKHQFDNTKIYNGESYKLTTASFPECTKSDMDKYISTLTSNGFEKSDDSSDNFLYFYDSAKNMVVLGLYDGYLSITVGTPAAG